MKPIEQRVTSLELSKELESLGAPQWSVFYWVRQDMQGDDFSIQVMQNKIHESYGKTICSAYLSDEIGDWLPTELKIVSTKNIGSDLYFFELPYLKYVCWNKMQNNFYKHFTGKTESEARGKMLKHLLKEGILKAEDLK